MGARAVWTTRFGGKYDVEVVVHGFYPMKTASGVRCPIIRLMDAEDGSQVAVASVNIPHYPLQEGEVTIKNWSENEGVLEFLIEQGVVDGPHAIAYSGYVGADVCRLRKEQEA